MCGIAGIIALTTASSPVDRDELLRIRDAMVPRGPDGAGEWISPDARIGLGHRRLAIIDLSDAGAQPMRDDETGCVIAFNGEVYNFQELRTGLEARGHRFRGHSDTEVLLRAYIEDGEGMLTSLRGMFAFAIWDPRRSGVLLARDQLGIKPLYIAASNGVVRFASQVKALLAGKGPLDLDPEPAGQVGFLLWGYVPEPYTVYRGIRALPAGCSAWVDSRGISAPRRFWSLRDEMLRAQESRPTVETEEGAEALLEALTDSVRHHLIADVPVGVFLSAGIDSTAMAAISASLSTGNPVRTLTLAFDEFRNTPQDEAPIASKLAEMLGTDHRTIRVRAEDFESDVSQALNSMDQPTVDGINTYFVSKAAHGAGLKVAISGLGGDELFLGYRHFTAIPRHVALTAVAAQIPGLGAAVRTAAAPVWRWLGKPKAAGVIEFGTDIPSSYLLHRALFMPWELAGIIDDRLLQEGLGELDTIARLRREVAGIRSQDLQISTLEIGNYMRDQLLRDSDWASMAHSLELRVPLVDTVLLRRVLELRASGVKCSKQQLCKTASAAAYDVIASRKKTGFGIPVTRWMARVGRPVRVSGHPMRAWALMVAERGRTA